MDVATTSGGTGTTGDNGNGALSVLVAAPAFENRCRAAR